MPVSPKRTVGNRRRTQKKVVQSGAAGKATAKPVEVPQELTETERNSHWYVYHAIITQMFVKLLRKYKRPPTHEEIAEQIKIDGKPIHRNTVGRHLDQKTLNDIMEPFKFATNQIMAQNVIDALNGDAQAKKIFFQIVWNTEDRHVHRFDWDTLHDDMATSRDRDKQLEDDPALAGIAR